MNRRGDSDLAFIVLLLFMGSLFVCLMAVKKDKSIEYCNQLCYPLVGEFKDTPNAVCNCATAEGWKPVVHGVFE